MREIRFFISIPFMFIGSFITWLGCWINPDENTSFGIGRDFFNIFRK